MSSRACEGKEDGEEGWLRGEQGLEMGEEMMSSRACDRAS